MVADEDSSAPREVPPVVDADGSARVRRQPALPGAHRAGQRQPRHLYTIDAGGLRTLFVLAVERQTAGTPGMSTFIDSQKSTTCSAAAQARRDTAARRSSTPTTSHPARRHRPRLAPTTRWATSPASGRRPLPQDRGEGEGSRVNRGDVRVRHRTGYRDKPVEQRMNDRHPGEPALGELRTRWGSLSSSAPQPARDGHALVPIHCASRSTR